MEGTADDIHGGEAPSSLTQDTGCLAATENVSCNMSARYGRIPAITMTLLKSLLCLIPRLS